MFVLCTLGAIEFLLVRRHKVKIDTLGTLLEAELKDLVRAIPKMAKAALCPNFGRKKRSPN